MTFGTLGTNMPCMKYRVITPRGAFIVNADTPDKAKAHIRRRGHEVVEVRKMGYTPPKKKEPRSE